MRRMRAMLGEEVRWWKPAPLPGTFMSLPFVMPRGGMDGLKYSSLIRVELELEGGMVSA